MEEGKKSGESLKYMAREAGGFDSPEPQSKIQHTLFSNTFRSNTGVSQCQQRPQALEVGREKRPWDEFVGYRESKGYSTMEIILFFCKRVTRFSSNQKQQEE